MKHLQSRSLVALTISVVACLRSAPAANAASEGEGAAALTKTVQTCGTCHGVAGQSISPTFPNLAAQTAPYIEAQLKAFKDQTRSDPDAQAYMWGMASQLSDAMIGDVAKYFAKQPAVPGHSTDPKLAARGQELFEKGIPTQQIPPCASCHGAQGQGMNIFPRLAGQHAPYLLKQLLVIQSALRNAPVMHGIVKALTPDQMQAVAAYLESI
ncbi:MAG: c-type cytochrome [Gammaproteobacteria bacterium]